MHAAWLLIVLLAGPVGCDQRPDGTFVDGLWIGRPMVCSDDLPPELTCERLIACALEREWPDGAPPLRSAVVFDPPERMRDGTLINYGGGGRIVVVTLTDGARIAVPVMSTDGCPAS